MCRGIQIILIAGLALFTSVETSAQQKENETLIEAQALGSALQVLAEEYDLQVLFESAVVANHTATAMRRWVICWRAPISLMNSLMNAPLRFEEEAVKLFLRVSEVTVTQKT